LPVPFGACFPTGGRVRPVLAGAGANVELGKAGCFNVRSKAILETEIW
jgi:hypothetical protein